MGMAKKVTPYKHSELGKKEQVTQMFDTISDHYDGLNRIISLGSDMAWRRRVVRLVDDENPDRILDIATGTGDLAIQLAETRATQIVGIDISEGMLSVGVGKVREKGLVGKIEMIRGDSEALPFETGQFDAATVAFGVRNFENLEKGLAEVYRVLCPGGRFVILETSIPTRFPFKQGYKIYARGIMPLIGRIFSKDRTAYSYLSKSAAAFPYGEAFNNILRKIGFIDVADEPQMFGAASIYVAKKPESANITDR